MPVDVAIPRELASTVARARAPSERACHSSRRTPASARWNAVGVSGLDEPAVLAVDEAVAASRSPASA